MQAFEIRIIKNGAIAKVYKAVLSSAFAAIRRARSLAEDGDIVEVWQGLECIFAGTLPAAQVR